MAELTPEEQSKQSEAYMKGLEADLALSLEGVKISAQAFDRQIVYIAGGTLALTIGFLKDILPLAPPGALYLLLIAWLSFGLSLLFNLIGHQRSTEGYSERMALAMHHRLVHESSDPVNEDENAAKVQGHTDKITAATRDVNRLNGWQTVSIGTGILFIIIFAFLLFKNLPATAIGNPGKTPVTAKLTDTTAKAAPPVPVTLPDTTQVKKQ